MSCIFFCDVQLSRQRFVDHPGGLWFPFFVIQADYLLILVHFMTS